MSPNSVKNEEENRKELIYSKLRNIFKFNKFKFENTDDYSRKFGFEVLSWYNKAAIKMEFKEDEESDDAVNIPIEIVAYPDENSDLIKIFDETN